MALIAGISRLWTEQQGYQEQARDFERIGRALRTHHWALTEQGKPHLESIKILQEIDIEALEVHGRWLLLHRERPLQVVASA